MVIRSGVQPILPAVIGSNFGPQPETNEPNTKRASRVRICADTIRNAFPSVTRIERAM